MKKILVHATETVVANPGERFYEVHFAGTGSTIGRFLFTPKVLLTVKVDDVEIRNCWFTGLK